MGSSGRSDSNERALLVNPPAGEYRIEVYGYALPGDTANVQLDIAEISGLGSMTVAGAPMSIVTGELYTMSLHFEDRPGRGTWYCTWVGPRWRAVIHRCVVYFRLSIVAHIEEI